MKSNSRYSMPDPRAYTHKPFEQWNKQDVEQATEHAINIMKKFTTSALASTRGHATPLGMIMFKQAVALMLQTGWQPAQIAMFGVEVLDDFTGNKNNDKQENVNG